MKSTMVNISTARNVEGKNTNSKSMECIRCKIRNNKIVSMINREIGGQKYWECPDCKYTYPHLD